MPDWDMGIASDRLHHTVEYDSATGCLHIRISGRLDIVGVRAAFDNIFARAREHGCRCMLTDLRGTEIGLDKVDLFDIATHFSTHAAPGLSRRAIVAAAAPDLTRFYETASANRGQHVRVFRDLDSAREWLFGQKAPPDPAATR
ncbi:MAG: STAS/SEC14 domain-containing protein [bacterium]